MENLKKTLTGLLSTAYEKDETAVASLYLEDGSDIKPDAFDTIKQWDVERVAKLKPDTKKIFDDGYKKAQSEVLSKLEKDITEKFGVKSEKKGIELIEEIYAAAKATAGTGTGLSADDVKKSKEYLDLFEQKKAIETDLGTKYIPKEEFESYKSSVEREKTFAKVADQALTIFAGLKPILNPDPLKAKNQQAILVNELANHKYEVREGKIVILNTDGSDMQDGHGNRIPFEKLVKDTADRYFDYQASDPKGNGGNGNGGGTNPIVTPKTEEEFTKAFLSEKDPLKRVALTDAWREEQKKQTTT